MAGGRAERASNSFTFASWGFSLVPHEVTSAVWRIVDSLDFGKYLAYMNHLHRRHLTAPRELASINRLHGQQRRGRGEFGNLERMPESLTAGGAGECNRRSPKRVGTGLV